MNPMHSSLPNNPQRRERLFNAAAHRAVPADFEVRSAAPDTTLIELSEHGAENCDRQADAN